jgi:mannose-1-phosphate guanylyltransferase/mannose-6-phosphate isomerase
MRINCFVMSGGIGSRLWPLSREDNPKQFHDLSGSGSMLVTTIRRLRSRTGAETPVNLIASERHAVRISSEIAGIDLGGGVALLEPIGRNTAAAVAVAALQTLNTKGDELVLVVPSDHEIRTHEQFWETVELGVAHAMTGHLVVFGIRPSHPETGYGYIETSEIRPDDGVADVVRFVEKPDSETAMGYLKAGNFFWNSGIFLFRAGAMRELFEKFAPGIWNDAAEALEKSTSDVNGTYLAADAYGRMESNSVDYAIAEHAENIVMAPASFSWNDLGSWQSLLDIGGADEHGNVVSGDVVAIDCRNSYLRSSGRLLSAIGLDGLAIVNTPDATFVAPVSQSQNVKKIVEKLEKTGRLETRITPSADGMPHPGAWVERVKHWFFDETLPLWSTAGVDEKHGGFYEALSFEGKPLARPKRMRTIARQIFAFAVAKERGWGGPADELIDHGISFIVKHGRSANGGWVRVLDIDGSVADPVEDIYDHSCVLLALAHAHCCGHPDAARLGMETFQFVDKFLEEPSFRGFRETPEDNGARRSNPHMHMFEAYQAWHRATGEQDYLRKAARIVDLFRSRMFDPDTWTMGEHFDSDWWPERGEAGQVTEPGHHFEWASLLVDFAASSGQTDLNAYARKLYASAIANGLNRSTGLAYGSVTRQGIPLDTVSRSWPQTEAVKAAIALDRTGGPDMKPEIEARVGRLFRWHVDPAPPGLWIDRIDESGRSCADHVPASIFYHMVTALTRYLDAVGDRVQ